MVAAIIRMGKINFAGEIAQASCSCLKLGGSSNVRTDCSISASGMMFRTGSTGGSTGSWCVIGTEPAFAPPASNLGDQIEAKIKRLQASGDLQPDASEQAQLEAAIAKLKTFAGSGSPSGHRARRKPPGGGSCRGLGS